MFAAGVIDYPRQRSVVDPFAGLEVARKIEEGGIVLLKNDKAHAAAESQRDCTRIAVIGSHSDVGMISGGGSAQVDPPGGNAILPPGQGATHWQEEIWFPTSPLKAIQARAPQATVKYDSGADPAAAAALAKGADVAIVFAYQWESEGMDLPSLSLPHNQDALIAAVAAANPHTIVVLETGNRRSPCPGSTRRRRFSKRGSRVATAPMRWAMFCSAPSTRAASCPTRSRRARPICRIPPSRCRRRSRALLTDAAIAGAVGHGSAAVSGDLRRRREGWLQVVRRREKKPLFPVRLWTFLHDLSLLRSVGDAGRQGESDLHLANTGAREGAEIAEVYAALPAAAQEPPKRLVGWRKVKLNAGRKAQRDSRDRSEVSVDLRRKKNGWTLVPGDYTIMVGGSSTDLPLKATVNLK